MFISILTFLLEVVFGLLASTCLLRLVMQRLRVPFANPFGRFVIALSNWLVLPLRKVLPSVAGWDTASFAAAWLLVLLHQALLLGAALVFGGTDLGGNWFLSLPIAACFGLLRMALSGLFALLVVYAVLSWIPQASQSSDMGDVVDRLCNPLLAPLRKLIPLVGGIDLSVLVALVLVQIAQMLVAGLQAGVMRAL